MQDNKKKQAITGAISACQIWPSQAVEKIGDMIEEIRRAESLMTRISSTAQSDAIKGGFAAEAFHAESFNLDAILKDKSVRAFTDEFANSPITKNHQVHDIVVMRDGEQILGAQSKYFANADKTQNAFRSTKDGVHRYAESDVFLGPSDQIDGIRASAQRAHLTNSETRPEVSSAAEKIRDKVSGRLEVDEVRSTPLSKRGAEQMGSGSNAGKTLHEDMQGGYLNAATLQQSARAASSAAVITAVTAGCINAFQCLRQVRSGEISEEQAVRIILRDTVIAAGDSALKAGVATASVASAARALPGLFVGTAFKRSLATGGVATAAICVVDAVQGLVLFAAGKISSQELETRVGKNALQSGAAVVGSAIGASLGALGGPVGAFIGGLAGGVITSLAMTIALDNNIERNFNLTLDATGKVVGNGLAAQDTLAYLHRSQAFFGQFEQDLYLSERHFASQVRTLQAQSVRLKDKINNL